VLFVARGSIEVCSRSRFARFVDPHFFSGIDMNDELEIIATLLLTVAIGAVIALWYLLAQVFRDSP
jgi:hypothetical protein